MLVQNRKLDTETHDFVVQSLSLGCNKNKIIDAIVEKGHNRPILKDIHNIEQKMKKNIKKIIFPKFLTFYKKIVCNNTYV